MNQVNFKKIKKACFLDRDGVINQDVGYLHKIKDFKWIDGAIDAIRYLKKKNYLVIVVTNQSGIERGYYNIKDMCNLHDWMNSFLKKFDTKIDDFFFATELPSNNPVRRKPSPEMINEAIKKYSLERAKCFLIGDNLSDLEAAKNAKIKGFLFNEKNLYERIIKILKYEII